MKFYVGKQTILLNNIYFEVNLSSQAITIKLVVEEICSHFGLVPVNVIQIFADFIHYPTFLDDHMRKAGINPIIQNHLKKNPKTVTKLAIETSDSFIDDLKRFGIDLNIDAQKKVTFKGYNTNFALNTGAKIGIPSSKSLSQIDYPQLQLLQKDIFQMNITEKFLEAIKRAIFQLPAEIGKELLSLLTLQNLGIAVGVVIVWAVFHFFGLGQIIDVIILIVGVISIGAIAYIAGEHLINFAVKTFNAKATDDLDEAAKHLAEAISLLGVQVIMALLLKKAPKALNEQPDWRSLKLSEIPKTKRPSGEWFYKPKISESSYLGHKVLGTTDIYGDIKYLTKLTGKAKESTILHEKVHRWLTPKFYPFRNFRMVLNWNSYARSYLLRYLEEAIAQIVGLVGVYGFRQVFSGICFPVKNGYVTLSAMTIEAAGILLRPINVSGMTFNVYFAYSKPDLEK